jgi:Rha family phage regulatory protein
MSELIFKHNNAPCTSSRMVAEKFNKLHAHVLRTIKNVECSEVFRQSNFGLSSYEQTLPNGAIKKVPEYILTKNGFVFLVMGFTGKEAAKFKEEYINAFDKMEQELTTQRAGALMLATADLVEIIDKAAQMVGSYNRLSRRIGVSGASLSILRNYGIAGKANHVQSEALIQKIELHCKRIVEGHLGYNPELTDIILDISNKRARLMITDYLKRGAVL